MRRWFPVNNCNLLRVGSNLSMMRPYLSIPTMLCSMKRNLKPKTSFSILIPILSRRIIIIIKIIADPQWGFHTDNKTPVDSIVCSSEEIPSPTRSPLRNLGRVDRRTFKKEKSRVQINSPALSSTEIQFMD